MHFFNFEFKSLNSNNAYHTDVYNLLYKIIVLKVKGSFARCNLRNRNVCRYYTNATHKWGNSIPRAMDQYTEFHLRIRRVVRLQLCIYCC